MFYFLLLGLGSGLLFALLRWLAQADTHVLAWALRWTLISALIVVSCFLLLTGRLVPILSGLIALAPLLYPLISSLRERSFQKRTMGPSEGGFSQPMSIEEAYKILDLKSGASVKAIKAAHHRMMKKLHPDHGGSTYLATKLNQAKETLLNKRNL